MLSSSLVPADFLIAGRQAGASMAPEMVNSDAM